MLPRVEQALHVAAASRQFLVGPVVGGAQLACEISFWVFLISELVVQYVFRVRRTSAVLLVMAPLVDVVLLIATVIDLHNGGTADWSHDLAALYIGFSVAYGHRLILWADVRFAHRFAGGPAPRR